MATILATSTPVYLSCLLTPLAARRTTKTNESEEIKNKKRGRRTKHCMKEKKIEELPLTQIARYQLRKYISVLSAGTRHGFVCDTITHTSPRMLLLWILAILALFISEKTGIDQRTTLYSGNMRSGLQTPGAIPLLAVLVAALLSITPNLCEAWTKPGSSPSIGVYFSN